MKCEYKMEALFKAFAKMMAHGWWQQIQIQKCKMEALCQSFAKEMALK